MLNPTEKQRIKRRDTLPDRTRTNLDYRVAQKIEKRLSELIEIDYALCSIPENNARRHINDEMVAYLFHLTESILQILRYVPVEEGPDGLRYVSKPETVRKNNKIQIVGKIEPANKEDEARHLLLEEHMKKLQQIMQPSIRVPIEDVIDNLPSSFREQNNAHMEGHRLYNTWKDKITFFNTQENADETKKC